MNVLKLWTKLAEITENFKKKKYVDALQTQLIFQNPQTPQQNSLARLPTKTLQQYSPARLPSKTPQQDSSARLLSKTP